jgi:DNA-binding beta-propeller fold protein YncE
MLKRVEFDVNGFLGGQNTDDSPYKLKKNEFADSSNMDLTGEGHLSKITGTAKINSVTTGATDYVTTLHEYVDSYGNKIQFCIAGTKLYKNLSGTWTEVSDAMGNKKVLSSNQRASIFTWKNKLFISNGNEPAFSYGPEAINSTALFVSDVNNYRVQSFSLSGTYYLQWGNQGSGSSQFSTHQALAVDSTNLKIYVADAGNHSFGSSGTGNGQFNTCRGVAVDPANSKVYVADSGNSRIQYFDLSGTYLGKWGSSGSGDGAFNNPYVVKVDTVNSKVYVADTGNKRIQYFSLTGTYQGKWGSSGTGNGEFSNPMGISIDTTNSKVYVADSTNNRIQYFNLTGTYGGQFGSVGTGNGQFVVPMDVFVDVANTKIYVADSFNNRVQYFNLTTYAYIGQWGSGNGAGSSDPGGFKSAQFLDGYVSTGRIELNMFHDLGTPLSPTATLLATSGNLTGTFKYKLTYVTGGSLESSGGIESNAIAATGQQIRLTLLPTLLSTDTVNTYGIPSQVTEWYLYRAYSADGGSTYEDYKFITNRVVNVGANNTYDDNKAVGSEGDTIPSINEIVPAFKYLIVYNDVLIGTGDYLDQANVYWTNGYNAITNFNNENNWESGYFLPFGVDDGFPVNGIQMLGSTLIVGKDENVYSGTFNITSNSYGAGLITLTPNLITEEYGCVSGFTMKPVTIEKANGLIFIDKDKGFVFCNGTNVIQLTDQFDSDIAAMNKIYMKNSYACYFTALNEYRWTVTATGTTNNQVWVYNTKLRRAFKPWTMNVCSFARIETSSGLEQIWYGDFTGFVYKMDYGNDLAGADLSSYFTTPYYHLGYPMHEKVFDKLTIDFIRRGSWSFTVQYSVDGGTLTTLGTVDQTGTATQRSNYTFRLPSLHGKYIAIKILNTTKDTPFEICGFEISARIHKVNLPY